MFGEIFIKKEIDEPMKVRDIPVRHERNFVPERGFAHEIRAFPPSPQVAGVKQESAIGFFPLLFLILLFANGDQ